MSAVCVHETVEIATDEQTTLFTGLDLVQTCKGCRRTSMECKDLVPCVIHVSEAQRWKCCSVFSNGDMCAPVQS